MNIGYLYRIWHVVPVAPVPEPAEPEHHDVPESVAATRRVD